MENVLEKRRIKAEKKMEIKKLNFLCKIAYIFFDHEKAVFILIYDISENLTESLRVCKLEFGNL